MKIYFNRCLIYLLSLLVLHLQAPSVLPKNQPRMRSISQDSKVVQGYLPFWNDHYQPDVKSISRLSSVVLAFAVPQNDGSVNYDHSLQENLNAALGAIRAAKKINPNLKLMWAIGGWGNSENFAAAVSPALRRKFVANILDFLDRFKADGLDIDWEFPKTSDRSNLTEFLKELSAESKKRGKDYQLTIAVNAVEGDNTAGLDLPNLAAYVHHFNLMTYDFYGGWSQTAGLHTAVFPTSRLTENKLNAQSSIDFYLKSGVPAQKIVIGASSYGKIQAVAATSRATDGLGEKSSGAGRFTVLSKKYSDEISFSELEKLPNQWQRFYDAEAQSPYLYNQTNRIFISYEDARSVQAKIKLVKEKNLGGMMIWDLPGDADHTLLNEIFSGFSSK